ncbi:MAG: hypothetical protein QGG58_08375, partial [Chloroflexota bacterium]|nr:hypothetical protein [Chloroflexota bacterium]
MAAPARRYRFLERGTLSWPDLDPLLLILAIVLPLIGGVVVASALMPVMADDAAATEAVHARDLQAKMRAYIAETGRRVIMVPHIGGRRSDFEAQD